MHFDKAIARNKIVQFSPYLVCVCVCLHKNCKTTGQKNVVLLTHGYITCSRNVDGKVYPQ